MYRRRRASLILASRSSVTAWPGSIPSPWSRWICDGPTVGGSAVDRQPALQEGLAMLQFARKFFQDERGEDLMEYGLLVAFVASVALAVIITDPLGCGTAIRDAYQKAVDALNQA